MMRLLDDPTRPPPACEYPRRDAFLLTIPPNLQARLCFKYSPRLVLPEQRRRARPSISTRSRRPKTQAGERVPPDDEVEVRMDMDGTFNGMLTPQPESLDLRPSDLPRELRRALEPLVPCRRDAGAGTLVFLDVLNEVAPFSTQHHTGVVFQDKAVAAIVGEAVRRDPAIKEGDVRRWVARMCTSPSALQLWVYTFTRTGRS